MVKLHLSKKDARDTTYTLDENGFNTIMLCAEWVKYCLNRTPKKLTIWLEAEYSGNIYAIVSNLSKVELIS